jgi:hypothetical protein
MPHGALSPHRETLRIVIFPQKLRLNPSPSAISQRFSGVC